MKKFYLPFTLVVTILTCVCSYAQDFSNKGKDFWVGYGYHQVFTGGNAQDMVLYFATESVTTVTVTIPGIGYSVTYSNIPANTVFASNPIPKTSPDARLTGEGVFNKGIHIVSDKNIVAYAHIYNASVSGATILYPTNTLGKEYYSVNYTNISNIANANCWFYVLACDTGITTVRITPSATTLDPTHAPGVPFTVNLTQGQIYNVMGTTTGNNGVDLTGSKIESISSATGACKRIAVYSGSGRIAISCNGSAPSSDNYMSQALPKTAWGKHYLTVPSSSYNSTAATGPILMNNFYRICVSDPTTNVLLNGAPITVPLQNGFYYQINATSEPLRIDADQPIMVAQYFPSQGGSGCGTPSGDGDPEVIYLSSKEQSINTVRWNACRPFAINYLKHWINVIIPNGGTALSSFKLDGVPVNPSVFTPHPYDPGFSYAVLNVTGSTSGAGVPHIVTSDSGFNAIAYGYGSAESYGYNAGTNVKDLYQFIQISNPYATVNFPASCQGQPFYFSIVFPYQPTSIQWNLTGIGYPNVTQNSPVYDSTWTVNGRQLYRYKLPTPYTIYGVGTFPIQVTAQNPTGDGCNNEQEINYDLEVFPPPIAAFTFNTSGCLTDSVRFFGTASNTGGRPVSVHSWQFGDGGTAAIQNPAHLYGAPNTYQVRYSLITDVGCLSDTTLQLVTISNPPVAAFTTVGPYCTGQTITFIDNSNTPPGNTIAKWYWNFGDGSPQVIATNGNPQTHVYATTGTFTATLKVETTSGCQSLLFSVPVTIGQKPMANFTFGGACLPSGSTSFTDQSTVSPGTITTWSWDFGDFTSSTLQNPTHNYATTGPFNVKLTVTSSSGCIDDTTKQMNLVFAQPHADFNVSSLTGCQGNTFIFTDISNAPASTVTQWFWDFGDGGNSTLQNPTHQYAIPGTYTVRHWVTSAAACMSDTMSKVITVVAGPTASFTYTNPLCQGTTIQFTSSSSTATGSITQYSWTVNGSPAGSNSATLNYTPTSSGMISVSLAVTTDIGCTNSVTQSVNIRPQPVANFTFTGACLPSGSTQFTSTSTISDGSQNLFIYLWDFGDGGTSTLQNPTHNYSTTGPFNVVLTVTSNNGCQHDTMKVMNTVYSQPQAAFTAPAEVCNGTIVNFTDNSTAPNNTVAQWNWNFGDGQTSTQQNPTHTYATPNSYTVTLTITSAAGCVSTTATKTVVVNPLPNANFNVTGPNCANQSITFTDASAANAGNLVKWTWSFGDGGTSSIQNPTHTYTTTGTFNVTLQVETNKGCVSTVMTKPVTVSALPTVDFTIPVGCFLDLNSQFTDQSSINGGTITQWLWNFGDANANAGNPNTSTSQNAQHNFTTPGAFNITLTATSNNGCSNTATKQYFVNGSPQAAYTLQGGNTTLCSGSVVNLTNNSTANPGNVVRVEIFWDYTGDPTIKTDDVSPSIGKVYSHTYPEFGSPATKTVTIRYVAYSGANCISSVDQILTLNATPTVVFNAVAGNCKDVPAFQITTASTTNALPGTGVFSGPGVSASGFFDPNIAGAGNHTIRYTYTASNGCANYKEQIVQVYPVPLANAGPDKFMIAGGVVTLTPAVNAGYPVTYLWTPPDYLDNPASSTPKASPPVDYTYTLEVTSDKGCSSSDQVFVKVLKSPIIPNIFSPNGDGVHDKWDIPYLSSYPGCTIDIYNRYGQLVFHSIGYDNAWDGAVNGKQVPVGTYYYIIDPKNGREKMTGYVDVIR